MPEFQTMNVLVAKRKTEYLARELSNFLSVFNETYPDPDAVNLKAHFDFVTPAYIARACGSVLAENFIIEAESDAPVDFDLDVHKLLPAIRGSLLGRLSGMPFLNRRSQGSLGLDISELKE